MLTVIVGDVMTRDVITVEPTTPFKDVVDLMVNEQISALPVVDRTGTLLGVVSEADLLCKEQHADDGDAAGPPHHFVGRAARAHWRKAAGLTALDVMTSPAVSVGSDASLPEAARQLASTGIRRLCVVDDGRLVGIVASRDLLRPYLRGDAEIQEQVDAEVLDHALHANPTMVRATVEHGVVMLTGRLSYQGDVAVAVRLARNVPGVVAVRNRLDWCWNGPGHATEDA